jgi:hypothetical protein
MKIAPCDFSGLLKQTIDCLSGDSGTEWAEILKRTFRKGAHQGGGSAPVSAAALWQTPAQAAGGSCSLQGLLDAAPQGETHTIDWYLEDPENRIPKEWEGKIVFFRNSKFRDGDGGSRCVRYLFWDGGRWCRGCSWVRNPVHGCDFLAVPASAL